MRWFVPIFSMGLVPVAALSACTTFGAATSDTDAGADSSVDTADANAADGGQKDSTVNAPGACPGGKARVFVTSESFAVTRFSASIKSPQIAADEICQAAASKAGLSTVWTAWLSTSTSAAPATMPTSAGYTDVRCERGIATVFGNGPLLAPINTTESGARLTDSLHTVWTGTKADGGIGATCSNWTSTAATPVTSGDTERKDDSWTDSPGVTCESSGRLYCIEGARKAP